MSNDPLHDQQMSAQRPDPATAEVVRKGSSALDVVLWLIAITLLIMATLTNQYLPQYWAPASQVSYRVAVIVGCIVLALAILYATHQGRGFSRLLRDSRNELRRVTWPTKQETLSSSWHVVVVILVAALILWAFDSILKLLIEFIIG